MTEYAYISVLNGECRGVCADEASVRDEFVQNAAKCGADLYRVPIEQARKALFHPWPENRCKSP